MSDRLFSMLRARAKTWRTEARDRRKIVASDPAAEALEYAAGELEQDLTMLEHGLAYLTTTEYAVLHGIRSTQTVRNWCRRGLLPGAHLAGSDWRIPRDAQRKAAAA